MLFATMPRTPSRSASVICEALNPGVSMITRPGAQRVVRERSATFSGTRGFDRSTTMTSDRQAPAASAQLLAEPTTWKSGCAANSRRKPSRLTAYSPRRNSRIAAWRPCRGDRAMAGCLERTRFDDRFGTAFPPLSPRPRCFLVRILVEPPWKAGSLRVSSWRRLAVQQFPDRYPGSKGRSAPIPIPVLFTEFSLGSQNLRPHADKRWRGSRRVSALWWLASAIFMTARTPMTEIVRKSSLDPVWSASLM